MIYPSKKLEKTYNEQQSTVCYASDSSTNFYNQKKHYFSKSKKHEDYGSPNKLRFNNRKKNSFHNNYVVPLAQRTFATQDNNLSFNNNSSMMIYEKKHPVFDDCIKEDIESKYQIINQLLEKQNLNLKQQNSLLMNRIYSLEQKKQRYKRTSRNYKSEMEQAIRQRDAHKNEAEQLKKIISEQLEFFHNKINNSPDNTALESPLSLLNSQPISFKEATPYIIHNNRYEKRENRDSIIPQSLQKISRYQLLKEHCYN